MIWFESESGGPRWKGVRKHFAEIHPSKRQEKIDQFCLTYPTWFFEWLTEVDGHPTILEDFQIEYLLDENSRYKISNKTRQAGGSLVVSMAKFWKCYRNVNTHCDIVSVNRAEAQGKITYIHNLWESLPREWRHPLATDTTEKISFHSGRYKSTIRSIAASAGVRGGRKDIVFDEAHHILNFETLFTAALPATVRNAGGFDAVSTPNGMQGKFYDIWVNGSGDWGDWSRHEFTWIDVSAFCKDREGARKALKEDFANSRDALVNHGEIYEYYATEALRKIGNSFTAEEFLQEFCGVFVDESTAFFPYLLIDACRKHSEAQPLDDNGHVDSRNVLEQWTARPEGNDQEILMGIDFAEGKKGGDSTSVQVVERAPGGLFKLRYSADLNHSQGYDDFDKQLKEIGRLIRAFSPSRVSVDETGLGRKIAADLKKEHSGRIDAITFTNQNKEEMALNLKGLLEQQKLWLPWDNKPLRAQIHNIKRKITAHGNMTYSGEPHDDMFWALALACRGLNKRGFEIHTISDDLAIRLI